MDDEAIRTWRSSRCLDSETFFKVLVISTDLKGPQTGPRGAGSVVF